MHVVLLGDSIFDNAPYIANDEPDVRAQVAGLLPGHQVTRLATDGHTTHDIPDQLAALPADATHLFVSIGGNDILSHFALMQQPAATIADALRLLADLGAGFEADYIRATAAVSERGLPTTLCTIYNPRYPVPDVQTRVTVGLAVFNDVIIRTVFARRVPLLDLRAVCTEDADFANPIEPSAAGGAKIAARIAHIAQQHDFSITQTVVYP